MCVDLLVLGVPDDNNDNDDEDEDDNDIDVVVPLQGTGQVTLGPLRVGDGTPTDQFPLATGDALEVDVAVEGVQGTPPPVHTLSRRKPFIVNTSDDDDDNDDNNGDDYENNDDDNLNDGVTFRQRRALR